MSTVMLGSSTSLVDELKDYILYNRVLTITIMLVLYRFTT